MRVDAPLKVGKEPTHCSYVKKAQTQCKWDWPSESVLASFRAVLRSTKARDSAALGIICLAQVILTARRHALKRGYETLGRRIEKPGWQKSRVFEAKDSITGTIAGPLQLSDTEQCVRSSVGWSGGLTPPI